MTDEEKQIAGYVETAINVLALTLPGPVTAALKLAAPELPALIDLIDQLRGGVDPADLRRAVGPSTKEIYDETLGGLGPDGQPRVAP